MPRLPERQLMPSNPEYVETQGAASGDIQQVCQERTRLYSLLSRLYEREIDAPLLEQMLTSSRDAQDGHMLPCDFVTQANACGTDQAVQDLATEFAALFLSGNRQRRVFPYESVYTSAEHLMMQESRDAVMNIFQTANLRRGDNVREPEDHIALEMAYMAHLNLEAAKASDQAGWQKAIALQQDFLRQHLMVWALDFCADLKKASRSAFYLWLAEFTRDFLTDEEEALRQLYQTNPDFTGRKHYD